MTKFTRFIMLATVVASLQGCELIFEDDDDERSEGAPVDYFVGGSVSGLTGTVVLQNNAGDDLSVAANGAYTFSTAIADGGAYNVTVSGQPAGQTCTVSNGNGTIASANVANVDVSCVDDAPVNYTVGGAVSGLTGTVVLQNNAGDDLSVAANGAYTFSTAIADGGAYNVTVSGQPAGQTCTVSNGNGTIASANVANADVSCVDDASTDATITTLSMSGGGFDQVFQSNQFAYTATVAFTVPSTVITATLAWGATATVDGVALVGVDSDSITLDEGDNTITIVVTAEDAVTTNTYTIVVTRQAAISFAQQAYIKASNTGSQDAFGFAVSLSGDTLAVSALSEDSDGSSEADNSASSAGAVYVFTRTSGVWSQQSYLKASNVEASDQFGYAISLSGDTLAVGAPLEDSDGSSEADNSVPSSGAVYVFTRTGGVWSQQSYIKASNPDIADVFGTSVSLSGDMLVVGAPLEDSQSTGINGDETDDVGLDSGAAYVFTRTANVWTQQAYIKASKTFPAGFSSYRDQFGQSVALDGDTLAVGAPEEWGGSTGVNGNQNDNTVPDSGAVYVFTLTANVWSQQAYIKASNTDRDDLFGTNLALSGNTLAVGVPEEASDGNDQANDLATDSGAVYVFTRTGTDWSQQAFLKASNLDEWDLFGTSVALDGDSLLIGAMGEASSSTGINAGDLDNSSPSAGAAYFYARSGTSWTKQAYIKASNTDGSDRFGFGVSVSGDTLVITAHLEESSATGIDGDQSNNSHTNGAGAAYVFK